MKSSDQEIQKELAGTLLKIKSAPDMLDFLRGLLTTKELQKIPTRLRIVKLLKKTIPQQRIAKKLKVGVATVSRASKAIQEGHFKDVK